MNWEYTSVREAKERVKAFADKYYLSDRSKSLLLEALFSTFEPTCEKLIEYFRIKEDISEHLKLENIEVCFKEVIESLEKEAEK